MENLKSRLRPQRFPNSRRGSGPYVSDGSDSDASLKKRRISSGASLTASGSRRKIPQVNSTSRLGNIAQSHLQQSPLCSLRSIQSLSTLPSLRGSTARVGTWTDPVIVPFDEGPPSAHSVTIKLRSCWCESPTISLSALAVLDSRLVPMRITAIAAVPPECERGILESVRPPMIKESGVPRWEAPFDPAVGVSVRLWVDSDEPLHSLRMWNVHESDGPAVRDFDVFVDDLFAVSGSLQPGLGKVLSLDTSVAREAAERRKHVDLGNGQWSRRWLRDSFGILPVGEVSTVEIVMIGSHKRELEVGLNAIQFFSWDGELIELPDTASIKLRHLQSYKSLRYLCNSDPHRVEPDQMWLGVITAPQGERAVMRINLGKPMRIGKVRIYNYNASGEDCDVGLARAGLRVDGRTVWLGRVRRAMGRRMDIDEYATDIPAHDVIR